MSPWHDQMDCLFRKTLNKVFYPLIVLSPDSYMHTNLALFHKLYETGPNVVLNHCGRRVFLAPTSMVGAQIKSCKRKYKNKVQKYIK